MQMSAGNLRRVLIASLVANVFLIAYVAAGWIAAYSGVPSYLAAALPASTAKAPKRHFDREAALAALDEPYRAKAQAIWANQGAQLRAKLKESRVLRRRLREMLAGDNLDPAAFDKMLAEIAKQRIESQAMFHAVLRQIVSELPADQRRRYFVSGRRAQRPR